MDIIHALDLFGTAVFAYTGANAAKRHNFHVIGVLYIAVLSAVGGGTLRTILMQEPTLFWVSSPDYMLVVALVVLYSYLPTGQLNTQKFYFYVVDAFALTVFISIGFTFTIAHHQPTHIAFTMGILTGIGGGLIRDAITSQHPQALSDPVYPLIIIAGSVGCAVSYYVGWEPWTVSVPAVMVAVFGTQLFHRLTDKKEFEAPEALHFAAHPNRQRFKNAQTAGYVALKALMVFSLTGTAAYFAYGEKFGIDALYARLTHPFNQDSPQHALYKSHDVALNTLSAAKPWLIHFPLPEFMIAPATIVTTESIQKPEIRQQNSNISLGEPKTRPAIPDTATTPDKADDTIIATKVTPAAPQVFIREVSRRTEKPATVIRQPLPATTIKQPPASDIKGSDSSAAKAAYAKEQFEALATAVKLRNSRALDILTTGDESKNEIFTALFNRYTEINVEINDFKHSENPTLFSAILQLENMRLPNGNLTLPPSSYGQIEINLAHTGDGWTRIQW